MKGNDNPVINVTDYYKRYGPMVLRRCRYLLKDEDNALDAMHEVFTKVLTKRDSLKDEYPSSLLYRMATNVCLNMIRAQHNDKYVTGNDDELLTNIALYEEKEEKLILNNLLDLIFKREKPSTREMAVLHFVDGMTLQETAEAVGLSMSGVRKRIRELRARIKQDGINEL